MKIIEFTGQNKILGPPRSWDNGSGPVTIGALPILETREHGVLFRRSCWKPSDEERQALLAGTAVIVLTIVGDGPHPPVLVQVGEVEELP